MVTKRELIEYQGEIAKIETDIAKVLPQTIPSEKFIRTVQTALQLNPGIVEASVSSVLSACLKAAADGLLLDGREAALVVYRTKAKGTIAQYLPMINGIIKQVRQSGEVSVLNSFVVYENDDFAITYGLDPTLEHRPATSGPRGKAVGAYAACKFKGDGSHDLEWMSYDDIEAIRARSKARNSGPWVTDWSEMARKTVTRRLCKRLPIGKDAMSAVTRIDEMYDLATPDDHVAPGRKKRGGGAAALGGDENGEAEIEEAEVTDVDPDEEPKPPKEKKETAKQKKARVAREAADTAEAEAEEETGGEGEGEESEDFI